jgi:hypothetical protein
MLDCPKIRVGKQGLINSVVDSEYYQVCTCPEHLATSKDIVSA